MDNTLQPHVIRGLCMMAGGLKVEDAIGVCRVCGSEFGESQTKAAAIRVDGVSFQFHVPCLMTELNQLLTVEDGYSGDARHKELAKYINTLERIGGEICLK